MKKNTLFMKNRARFISLICSLGSLSFIFVYMFTDVFTGSLPDMFSLTGLFMVSCLFGAAASVTGELMHPNSESDKQTQGLVRCISTAGFVAAILLFAWHTDSWIPAPYTVAGMIFALCVFFAAVTRLIAAIADCVESLREFSSQVSANVN